MPTSSDLGRRSPLEDGNRFRSLLFDKLHDRRLGVFLNFAYRLRAGASVGANTSRQVINWLLHSREATNYTYELNEINVEQMCHLIAHVTNNSYDTIHGYVNEARADPVLAEHVIELSRVSPFSHISDPKYLPGRRLGWYAFVRALKPTIVVETGLDKGLGAVALTAALLRNRSEGHVGYYYGTDINPNAGWLLKPPYSDVGRILYGDSIASLVDFDQRIDLFINDSDHSGEYEYREYLTIHDKLSRKAVILGDNSHFTNSLARFSRETGREFLFFQEAPQDHWYRGAGIGVSFKKSNAG